MSVAKALQRISLHLPRFPHGVPLLCVFCVSSNCCTTAQRESSRKRFLAQVVPCAFAQTNTCGLQGGAGLCVGAKPRSFPWHPHVTPHNGWGTSTPRPPPCRYRTGVAPGLAVPSAPGCRPPPPRAATAPLSHGPGEQLRPARPAPPRSGHRPLGACPPTPGEPRCELWPSLRPQCCEERRWSGGRSVGFGAGGGVCCRRPWRLQWSPFSWRTWPKRGVVGGGSE